jgi:hypothetical protein
MGRVASLILFLVVMLALVGAINGPPAYAATCADYTKPRPSTPTTPATPAAMASTALSPLTDGALLM